MTIMIVSLLALVLLIAGPAMYSRMILAYQKEAERLERVKTALELDIEELEAEVLELTAREDDIGRQRVSLMAMDQDLPSLGGPSPDGGKAYAGPVDYLLRTGRIGQEDVRKAEEFKTGSKSPYGLEEILVMLDVISSSEMKAAVAAAKASG